MTKMGTLINRITMSISASTLNSRLTKYVMRSFQTSFDDTQAEFDFKRSSPDPRSIAYLNERVIALSEKTADRLKGDLKYELVEGMKNAESIKEIKQRLAPVFDDMEGYELERLARNEVMDAMNAGRVEAYREDGDVKYKVWRAALKDKRTADDSKRLAGQIQPLNKPFVDPQTGKTCDHPPNRPNCRCGTIPLEELPEDIIYRGDLMYHPKYSHEGGAIVRREPKEAVVEKPEELVEFKEKLSKMDISDLKSEIGSIEKEYPSVKAGMAGWYRDKGMPALDSQLTSVFDMSPGSSRAAEPVAVDPDVAEGYKKIHAVTQEYLSRTNPDGKITVYRGLGSRTYQNFKHLAPGEDMDVVQYNLSSWTTDRSAAQIFAEDDVDGGVVIKTNIPASRVFIHPDCPSPEGGIHWAEEEVIVMKSDIKATVDELFEPYDPRDLM